MSSAPAVSRLLMGNWKMNGSLTENKQLIEQIVQALKEQPTKHQIVFCAPFVYLPQLQSLLAHSPIQWGAQNASAYKQGAYTGEVSAAMLSDFGCQWVIVGHSERRTLFHESSQETASKVEQVV